MVILCMVNDCHDADLLGYRLLGAFLEKIFRPNIAILSQLQLRVPDLKKQSIVRPDQYYMEQAESEN